MGRVWEIEDLIGEEIVKSPGSRVLVGIWRHHADRLDPALDLVDAWLDACALLDAELLDPRPQRDRLPGPF